MKNHWFVIVLMLAGCEDKTVIVPPQVATNNLPLLNQHMQENTNVYPRNNVQIAVDQSLKAITAPIQQDLLDIMGTERQSVDTNINGQRITFQYQVWKINQPSVCSQAQQNVMQFSECTQAAKIFFQSMCEQLQQEKQNRHPRTAQLQRMYCQAAIDFKPTVAQISRSQTESNDELKTLRKNCNDLIFKAKISEDIKDEKARDKACKTYKQAADLN